MEFDSIYQLIHLLLDKTKEEKIEWEPGPVSESYHSRIGENSVAIRKNRDDYFLSIYNSDGDNVEDISDPELTRAGYNEAFSMLDNLFMFARRNALGTDKVVSSILSELQTK